MKSMNKGLLIMSIFLNIAAALGISGCTPDNPSDNPVCGGTTVKTDENGEETWVQPWSEAQAQYEYFLGDNKPIIIINQNNNEENKEAIIDALSNNNIQAGDLMYFGEMDANGNILVHHATIITSIDNNSIYYAGNTISRFDYPLLDSFDSADNKMVFIVQIP